MTGIRLSHDIIEHTNNLADIRIADNENTNIPLTFINDTKEKSTEQIYIRSDISTDHLGQTISSIDRRNSVIEHFLVEVLLIKNTYTGNILLETSSDNNNWTQRARYTASTTNNSTLRIPYIPTTDRFIRITLSEKDIIASRLIGITSHAKYVLFNAKPKDTYKLYYGNNFATANGQKKLNLKDTNIQNDLQNIFFTTSTPSFVSKIGLRVDNPEYVDIQKQPAVVLSFDEKFPYFDTILYFLGSLGVLYLVYLVITKVEGSTKNKS